MASVFLHCHRRLKNGKEHCYWSITEKLRVSRGRWVQRHLLYLGEINDSQRAEWTKVIEVFDCQTNQTAELALYPAGQKVPDHAAEYGVEVRLKEFSLHRPRQWGACWMGSLMWEQLQMDEFWSQRLPNSREGTCWHHVLQTLVIYRLIDPGSEWRLHRQWFHDSAMADLLDEDFALVEKDTLYRCLDKILEHRTELFRHLRSRWEDLFQLKFEVLLYDLTSTYFESDPPFGQEDKRKFGYSRDKRSDCVQVVIALVVSPEGFPLAYEVMAGNTSDKTTLREFLKKIEQLHGKADRIWVMDRGIPTEAALAEMRASDPPANRTHHWVTGEPFSFADWGTGSPNYNLDFGDWVYASGGADHRWNTPYAKDYFFLVYVLEKANSNPQPTFATVDIYPAIEIAFDTILGQKYQIETSDDMTTWASFGDVILGSGSRHSKLTQARETARFVRVAVFK